MSSSTSSSKARRLGAVVLCAGLALAGLEAVMRWQVGRVSKDFSLYQTYPARAKQLADGTGARVALVGNSALQEGVDLDVLREQLREDTGAEVAADSFYAAGSHVSTWHYMLQHCFWRPRQVPDLIVLLYFDNCLADGNSIEVGRLGWCFTDRDDWAGVLGTDLTSFSERAGFLLSSHSLLVATRDRVKSRALALACPGYTEYQQKVNTINFAQRAAQTPAGQDQGRTHTVLERLLERARTNGSRLCFVAFPTLVAGRAEPYDLSADEVRLIVGAGDVFLDLRRVPGLVPDMYATRTHLNAAGRPVFSRHLARALAPVLRDCPATGSAKAP